MLHLCTLIFTIDIISAACNVHVLVPSPTHDDYTRPDYLLWSRNRTHSLGMCGAACVDDVFCVCFQYSVHQSACKAYSASLERLDVSASVNSPGYKTYLLDEALGSIGSTCDVTETCHIYNSVCENSICVCSEGFSFHSATGDCIDNAGEESCLEFSRTEGYYVAVTPPIETVATSSVEECLAACLESIETCLAFVFDKVYQDCKFYPHTELNLLDDPDSIYGARPNSCA